MTHFEIHELSKFFPKMNEDERLTLKEDIAHTGLQNPVILFNNKIIDGRHRYEICNELGIEIKTENFKGSEDEAFLYVISSNLMRRQISSSMRAILALEALPRITEQVQKKRIEKIKESRRDDRNLHKRLDAGETRSKEIIAKMFNTNRKYVDWAEAVKKANSKLFDEVKSGEKKLTQAYQEITDKTAIKNSPPAIKQYTNFKQQISKIKLSKQVKEDEDIAAAWKMLEDALDDKIAQLMPKE